MRLGHILVGVLLLGLYWLYTQSQETSWQTYAADHGCRLVEERQGNHWATLGLNGHPRVGASEGKEKWQCSDGKIYWRDKL